MSVDSTPFLSVLMTAYNREKYIAEAIESVLASTYTNFELIIVDDGSVDNTVKIANEYATNDERIKVYVNKKNLGQFPNRNHAMDFARGEYVMYVDSDDKIFADGFERLIKVMKSYPSSSFAMFSAKSEEVEVVESYEAINNHFFKMPFLFCGPGGTFLRREFLNRIGRYPVEYGVPGDMFFNLKACCFSPIVLIPFEFMYYRRHEGQEINNSYDYLYNNYKYLRDALIKLPLPITTAQKEWLSKKNKRRFVVSISRYFFKTLNVQKSSQAIKLADFHFKDFIQGIFH